MNADKILGTVEGTADRAVASQCQSEVAESHTPAPWPEPDTGLYAWGGKQDSVLKGGVLSMADYLHAQKCVNERDSLASQVAALREALAECIAELEAYDAPSDHMDSHNVRLAMAKAVLASGCL